MVRTTGLLLFVSSALVIAVAALSFGGSVQPASAGNSLDQEFFNGDANCDGWINSLDALAVLQFDAGLLDRLVFPPGGDSNADGEINSKDSLLILQFHAGFMPGKLPDPCFSVNPLPAPSVGELR